MRKEQGKPKTCNRVGILTKLNSMKKQFLFPVLALAFAVTGAFASNRLADLYFPGGDLACEQETEATIIPPCTPGDVSPCEDPANGNQAHYFKPNGDGKCQIFSKNTP